MPSPSRRRFLALAALAPVAKAGAQLVGGGGWSIRGTDPIELFHGERRVAAYRPGLEEGLPFLDPVVGPGGTSYTAPPAKREDGGTVSGHGMWFALGDANGRDFRPGVRDPDRPRGRIVHKGLNGVHIQGTAISIRTKSEWLDAEDGTRRICSDRRETTLLHRGEGSLVVDSQLELMADAGDLSIAEETDGLWSIRLAPGLAWPAEGVVLRNGEGLAGAAASGARSGWVCCQGKDAKGEPAGVAMFGHPANPGHPAAWMAGAAGLLAANPFAEGRVVPNGDSLVFRYRALFFQGGLEADELGKAYEAFAGQGN